MAVAASNVSHVQIGIFLEDRTTNSIDGEHINENELKSLVDDEFGLELIFQRSLFAQFSVCQEIESASDSRDHEQTTQARSIQEHATQFELSAEAGDANESVGGEILMKGSSNNNILNCVAIENSSEAPSADDHNACNSTDSVVKENKPVHYKVATFYPEHSYYGKQSNRLSKSERRQRKDARRKFSKVVDPSDIGFDFCISRKLIIPPEATPADKNLIPDSTDDSTTEIVTNVSTEVSVMSSETSTPTADCDKTQESNGDHLNSNGIEESTEIQHQDDESFFAEFGIDINDCGAYDWQDCLDRDGTYLTPPKSHSTPSKSKSKNDKRNKKSKDVKVTKTTCNSFEFSIPNYRMSSHEKTLLFNLECSSSPQIYLRKDKHRKIEKVHKAVKTPHCMVKNFMNNPGKKDIYIHHRILKMTAINTEFRLYFKSGPPPMPKTGVDLEVAKAIRLRRPSPIPVRRPAPAQNLRHVLHETNVPQMIESDLASFLLSLQNRDLTPEDYEMLLRLDDTVKAKTVSKNILSSLKTESVGEDIANILNCVICMEPYLLGQTRKFLPCDHDFHADCIDSWLTNSSQNCPLDGLPIEDS